jgi:mRNA interferase MazF
MAQCTTTIRSLPREVHLEPGTDPVPKLCVVNLDSLENVSVAVLTSRIGRPSHGRMQDICQAMAIAVGC